MKIKALDTDLPSFHRSSRPRLPELSEKCPLLEVGRLGSNPWLKIKNLLVGRIADLEKEVREHKIIEEKNARAVNKANHIRDMTKEAEAGYNELEYETFLNEVSKVEPAALWAAETKANYELLKEIKSGEIIDTDQELRIVMRDEEKTAQKVAEVSTLKVVSLECAHLQVDISHVQEKDATLPKEELVIGESRTNRITLNGHEIAAMWSVDVEKEPEA
ncbi:unnamed protein product [Arabidopsis lyrata]|nr:unnamed protein product [Arabidopsis lyrata]